MSDEMPEYRVRIEYDEEYNDNPSAFISWSAEEDAAYVARFNRGELTAYVVSLQKKCDMEEWHTVDSLCGCDCEASNADGLYDSPAEIADEYLRQHALDMWPQVMTQL